MKKGQAAMEFLMIYGWAILTVLIAIAALAYFGVLNPGKYMPSTCILESGLGCSDFKVTSLNDQISLIIKNGMGEDLSSFSISIGGECVGSDNVSTFIDGTEETFVIDCANILAGSRIKEDIFIYYTSEKGISHTKMGSIAARIE
jgi:uncharacterized protein (UPF0333 family)